LLLIYYEILGDIGVLLFIGEKEFLLKVNKKYIEINSRFETEAKDYNTIIISDIKEDVKDKDNSRQIAIPFYRFYGLSDKNKLTRFLNKFGIIIHYYFWYSLGFSKTHKNTEYSYTIYDYENYKFALENLRNFTKDVLRGIETNIDVDDENRIKNLLKIKFLQGEIASLNCNIKKIDESEISFRLLGKSECGFSIHKHMIDNQGKKIITVFSCKGIKEVIQVFVRVACLTQ